MAGPESVRYINEVRTLDFLYRNEGASRADIARMLGVSRSTMTNIISGLLSQNLVTEVLADSDSNQRAIGRPGVQIAINGRGAYFIGAEFGVRWITVVALDLLGTVHQSLRIPFDMVRAQPEDAVGELVRIINSDLNEGIAKSMIRGVAVSIPALVDSSGVVRNAPIIGWKDVPLRTILGAALRGGGLGCDIETTNDASALATAETRAGTGKRAKTILFLNMENGIGGAIVDNERLFGGNDGLAGEVGHLPVTAPDDTHPFGQSLEELIGQDAILKAVNARGLNCANIDEIVGAINSGNMDAQTAANDWGDTLSHGLLALINMLNPGLIIMGGTVADIFPLVRDRVLNRLEHALVSGLPVPEIEQSALGRYGSAIGAATLLQQQVFTINQQSLN